jgi:gamma-glutamyltranspeptidase
VIASISFLENTHARAVCSHHRQRAPRFLGNVNAIGIDGEGRWLGAADPRREGMARGF